jgi:hypothetical protein
MILQRPLFRSESARELKRLMLSTLGTPRTEDLPLIGPLASSRPPLVSPKNWKEEIFSSVALGFPAEIELISQILVYVPKNRPTAIEVLYQLTPIDTISFSRASLTLSLS